MKRIISLFAAILLVTTACNKESSQPDPYHSINLLADRSSASFLPMHIGNFWRKGQESSIDITDTLRLNGHLYYKFYTRISDAFATQYLRLDDRNQLWEGYPSQPGKEYLHAKFDAGINEVFYTLNDQTWNDYKVTVRNKTDTTRVFDFDMVYHPNLKGQLGTRTYFRGLGWADDAWDSVRINGVVRRR